MEEIRLYNQMRLVVYPIIYYGFYTSKRWWSPDFWTINNQQYVKFQGGRYLQYTSSMVRGDFKSWVLKSRFAIHECPAETSQNCLHFQPKSWCFLYPQQGAHENCKPGAENGVSICWKIAGEINQAMWKNICFFCVFHSSSKSMIWFLI